MDFSRALLSFALLGLGACANRRLAESSARAHRADEALRIGMTWDEVVQSAGTPGNCRGRPENSARCELRFEVRRADSFLLPTFMAPPPSASAPNGVGVPTESSAYSVYDLTFEAGRLKRWDRHSENSLH